jgi:phage baseplate assembly protein W
MYKDINASYTLNSLPAYLEDMNVIAQSISRLFSTKIGSTPFKRSFGSYLWNLLFENSTLDAYQIEMLIYQDISNWEPRIKINPNNVKLTKLDEHTYNINVTFIVPSLNNAVGQYSQQISE